MPAPYAALLLFASVAGTCVILSLGAGALVRRLGDTLAEDPIDDR